MNELSIFEVTVEGARDGADGRVVELQNSGSYIQWRYVGDTLWTNLASTASLKGDKGDQGDQGLNIRGAYDSLTAYVIDDVVTHDGSAYHCTANTQGNAPTNINYWGLLVAKGDVGTASFATLSDSPYDNTLLATELNAKANLDGGNTFDVGNEDFVVTDDVTYGYFTRLIGLFKRNPVIKPDGIVGQMAVANIESGSSSYINVVADDDGTSHVEIGADNADGAVSINCNVAADGSTAVVVTADDLTWGSNTVAVLSDLNSKQDSLGFTPVPDSRTVNGHALTSDVSVSASDVGLGNVDNTSDANKPVSTAQSTAIGLREPAITVGTTAQFWRGDKTWQDRPSAIATDIHAATDKTTPVDADEFGIWDSVTGLLNRLSLANLVTFFKLKLFHYYIASDTFENLTSNYSAVTNDGKSAYATNLGSKGNAVIASGGKWRPVNNTINFAPNFLEFIVMGGSGATYSQTGTTVTVIWSAHGFTTDQNGDYIYLTQSTGSLISGWFSNFTYVNDNSFTCISTVSQSTSGNLGTNVAETYIPSGTGLSTTIYAFPESLLIQGDGVQASFLRKNKTDASSKTIKTYYNGTLIDTAAATTAATYVSVAPGLCRYISDTVSILQSSSTIITDVNRDFKVSITLASNTSWCALRSVQISGVFI